jgi:hypothetical protein
MTRDEHGRDLSPKMKEALSLIRTGLLKQARQRLEEGKKQKYIVRLRSYVVQEATVEIDANSEDEAIALSSCHLRDALDYKTIAFIDAPEVEYSRASKAGVTPAWPAWSPPQSRDSNETS